MCAVPVLARQLETRSGWEAREAALALGRIGGSGKAVADSLAVALRRRDWRVGLGAVRALRLLPLDPARREALLAPPASDPAVPVRDAAGRGGGKR